MSDLNAISDIKLYHYESCPYCTITRQVINQIGLSIEKKAILLNPEHRVELIKGGGEHVLDSVTLQEAYPRVQRPGFSARITVTRKEE